MACEGLLEDLPRMLRKMSSHEAARNDVAGVLHQVATAMDRTAELLRTHLRVPELFVIPIGNAVLGRNVSAVCLHADRSLQCWQHRFLLMYAQFARCKGRLTSCCALGARVLGSDLTPAAACGAQRQCPIDLGRRNIL